MNKKQLKNIIDSALSRMIRYKGSWIRFKPNEEALLKAFVASKTKDWLLLQETIFVLAKTRKQIYKSLFTEVLKRQLKANNRKTNFTIFSTLCAIQDLGEDGIFNHRGGGVLDGARNRRLAKAYLKKVQR